MKDSFGTLVFLIIYALFIFFMPNALGHPDNYIPADPLVTPPHIVPEWYFLPFYAMLRAITFETNLMMLGGAAVMFLPFFWNVGAGISKMTVGMKLPTFKEMTPQPIFLSIGLIIAGLGFVLHGKIPLITDFTFFDAKLGGVLVMFGSILIWLFLPWLDGHNVRSARFRPVMRPLFLLLVVLFLFLGYAGAKSADATLLGIPLSLYALAATGYYFAYFLVILPILAKQEKALPLPPSIHEAVLAKEEAKKKSAPEAAK
jgi:ubiquinol-cytochrome c reductase cytochrome b subunit